MSTNVHPLHVDSGDENPPQTAVNAARVENTANLRDSDDDDIDAPPLPAAWKNEMQSSAMAELAKNSSTSGVPAPKSPASADQRSADFNKLARPVPSFSDEKSKVNSASVKVSKTEEVSEDPNESSNGVKVKVMKNGKSRFEELDPRELARLYAQQQAALRSVQGQFDFLTVPDWVRLHPLLGSYVAEAFGTFAFVLTLSLVSVRNQSIFDTADDTNMTSLPIGFMLMCMIFTFGYISGGHFNPAITLSVFLIGKLDAARTAGYLICQMGASLGAGLVSMAIQGSNDIFVPSVDVGYVSSGIFSELIYTFAIAIVVLNVAYSRQKGNFFYGFAIGMTIAAGSASVGRISGGAFNPAAATGLQLALCLTGSCEPLRSFWVYWLAPLVGAILASLIYSQMYQPTGTQVLQDVNVFKEQNSPIVDQVQPEQEAKERNAAAMNL